MWETNWSEGNALFAYMSLALLPEYRDAAQIAAKRAPTAPHAAQALQSARETLELYPLDRVMHPVMNSIRKDIEVRSAPGRGGARQALALEAVADQRAPLRQRIRLEGERLPA